MRVVTLQVPTSCGKLQRAILFAKTRDCSAFIYTLSTEMCFCTKQTEIKSMVNTYTLLSVPETFYLGTDYFASYKYYDCDFAHK